jgi:uncharacterized protein YvpB
MNWQVFDSPHHWFYAWLAVTVFLVIFVLAKITHRSVHIRYRNYDFHFPPTFPLPRNLKNLLFVLSSIFWLGSGAYIFFPTPDAISPSLPMFEPITLTSQSPLEIRFNRPIPKIIEPSIFPPVEGEWSYRKHGYGKLLTDTLIFTPEEPLLFDHEYAISLDQILPLTWVNLNQATSLLFVFSTSQAPEVADDAPISLEEIAINQTIDIPLTHDQHYGVEWRAVSQPAHEISVMTKDDTLALSPASAWHYGTPYSLTIERKLTGEPTFSPQHQISFTTLKSPGLESIAPNTRSLGLSEPLLLSFTQPIQADNLRYDLSPSIELLVQSIDSHTLSLQPQSRWPESDEIILTLQTSTVFSSGDTLPEKITQPLKISGEPTLISTNPADTSIGIPVNSPIVLTFDQLMDEDKVLSALEINPTIQFTTTWDENSLTLTPQSPLEYQKTYSLTLPSGDFARDGLPLTKPLKISFTTQPGSFRLAVPLHKQNYTFTCYSAASRMALGYRGVAIDERGFLDEIGFVDTPRSFATNSWGNPNKGIVGTFDGSGVGGYGAHWEPVANAIRAYRPTEIKRQWNVKDLLQTVANGNPVMVWWVNGVWPAKDVSWNSPDGKVYTVNGMHVEVVVGFEGLITNPTAIYTNDPWRGRRTYTQKGFENLWRWFNNTAVIVY